MGKAVGEKPLSDTLVPKNNTEKDTAVLDRLNKENEFKIIKKWSGFTIQHISLNEPISLRIASLEQATEFRKFLQVKQIENQTCIQLEGLSECILVNPDNNPYSRWLGMTKDVFRSGDGTIARLVGTPVLAPEILPASVRGKQENVSLLKNYMNDIMRASQVIVASK